VACETRQRTADSQNNNSLVQVVAVARQPAAQLLLLDIPHCCRAILAG
jgi:hypothetical protein